jgi:hypothetical protein
MVLPPELSGRTIADVCCACPYPGSRSRTKAMRGKSVKRMPQIEGLSTRFIALCLFCENALNDASECVFLSERDELRSGVT